MSMQTRIIVAAICSFNWERSFANKDVNEMVNIFNEIICDVLNNYIPHEAMTCDDQDPHGLITKLKKLLYKRKISFLAEFSQILIMVLF